MALRIAILLLLALPALSACNDSPVCPECEPQERTTLVAQSGLVTLSPYTDTEAFAKAHVSFKYATVVDDPLVNNNWDVIFDAGDTFRVNSVTDDVSWIVDLGPIAMEHIPETIDLEKYGNGLYATHDHVPAFQDHVYLVRNVDTTTRQYAAFRVAGYEEGKSVTLQWFRSIDPEKFVFPTGTK